ncbi:MAG: DUF2190 family protein [Ahrensia sp.]|nr:DUF2190 family protein [Ahrensia sp.]
MVATKDIDAPSRSGDRYGFPALAGQLFYGRAVVGVTIDGEAVPAGHADAVALMGLAEQRVDNTAGQTGDVTVECLRGVYRYPVAGANPSNIGEAVYAADDNTLQLTNAGGELLLGTLEAIDADGTWIRI